MTIRLRQATTPVLAAVAAYLIVAAVLRRDGYDFRIFYTAGQAVASGHSPYPSTAAQLRWHGFVYPLPTAWLFAPLTLLSRGTAYLVYTAICATALAAGVIAAGVRRSSFSLSLSLYFGIRTPRAEPRYGRTAAGVMPRADLAVA